MFEALFNAVRREIVSELVGTLVELIDFTALQYKGCERPSISATLVKNSDRNGLSNREMAWMVGTLLCVLSLFF